MQSQSPRTGMSRRNMTSRRGGLGKLPKILILAAVVVGLVFFFWGGDTPESGENASEGGGSGGATESLASTDFDGLPGLVTAPPLPLPDTSTTQAPAVPTPAIQPLPDPAPEVKPINPRPEPAPGSNAAPPETSGGSSGGGEADPGVVKAVRDITEAMPAPKRFTSGADAATLYNRGDQLIAEGNTVEGRAVLSRLLFADNLKLSAADAAAVRQRLTDVNQKLFWSRDIVVGDTITMPYQNDGKFLSQIGVQFRVPYQLLETINNMDARNLQAEQTIKVVKGPLHARVSKSRFLMDIYAVDPEGMPVYICTMPVGLGENTPLGNWEVIKGSKVVNPSWRDEINGEFFTADNPENPIGEYWIAIEGLDDANRDKRGFGIHGTIDPDSIGKEESRGCIRLVDGDIERVFNMLTDHSQGSTVQIVP